MKSRLLGAVCVFLLSIITTSLWAGSYEFTTIADSNGQYKFFGFPTINNYGVVAFPAGINVGFEGMGPATHDGGEVILRGGGGPLTTIADGGGRFYRVQPRRNFY